MCPELREASLLYWRGQTPDVVDAMLAAATKLEKFDSYKLWSNDSLAFASPNLKEIWIHRSDCLTELSIWAPNLTSLRLQGCYDLEAIEFPASHPLQASLPRGWRRCAEPLVVDTLNSNLGEEALAALRAHPRAVMGQAEPDGPVNPLEAYFASMRSAMP